MTPIMPALASASSPAHKKRHTKPCIYFQTGQCPFPAEDCDFAHVYDAHAVLGPDSLKSKYRTKPCRYYLQGSCSQGIWCRFKHPVGSFPRLSVNDTDEEDFDTVPDIRDAEPQMTRTRRELHPKYKTRPCREWLMGMCQRGESCSYLHEHAPRTNAPPMSLVYSYPYPAYMVFSPTVPASSSREPTATPPRMEEHYVELDGSPGSIALSSPSNSSFNSDAPQTPVDVHLPFIRAPKDHAMYDGPTYTSSITSPVALMHPPFPMALAYPGAAWQPAPPQYSVAISSSRARSQPPGGRRRAASHRTKDCKQPAVSSKSPRDERYTRSHLPPSIQSPGVSSPSAASGFGGESARHPSELDEQRNKGYWPISWRVVGGGVKMGVPDSDKANAHDDARAAILRDETTISLDCEPVDSSKLAVPEPNAPARGHSARKNMSISIPAPTPFVGLEVERNPKALRVRSTPSSPGARQMVDLPKLFSSIAL